MGTFHDALFQGESGESGESAPPRGEDVLYESPRTRVTRVRSADGAPLIHKELLGQGSVQRARRERATLEMLAGVPGVPRLAAGRYPDNVVAVEDAGGVVLAELVRDRPMATSELLDLARRLTRVVAAVHGRGVVHKDINPSNIIVDPRTREPVLVDFGLATTFAEERPGFTHESQIAGTLAYLAPEQTGRTGRAVDQRADLYAIGAMLYQLATGRPPFGDGDPLQLIHAHLAQVPRPPAALGLGIPAEVSDVILRLLAKEPDERYQSADGLAHDLNRIVERRAVGDAGPFVVGERDFPQRLAAPSRLVGRDAEIAALRAAFDHAMTAGGGGVLVSGGPGVGKTALVDELRPIVAARGGWFVAGRFDQYRHDMTGNAFVQTTRSLGRLLLAEPERELRILRDRIVSTARSNVGLIAAASPEFALLLDLEPDPDDEVSDDQVRHFQAGLDLLRAVVSPTRPLVMVVDDLQWASSTPIGFLDAILADDDLSGLLLVATYRDEEVDAAHPLTDVLSRWDRLGVSPARLRLANLPEEDIGLLLEEMLRLPPGQAKRLGSAVWARTAGNPYDTVELINALRRDGVLVPGTEGWAWEDTVLNRHVGAGDVVSLLWGRIERLPESAQDVLEATACLGGEVELPVLQAATGLPAETLEEHLAPALEDGLLVLDQAGDGTVRFRHDRVLQTTHARVDPVRLRRLHLSLARRLATVPRLTPVAAQQYLPAVDDLTDPAERRRVADLFRVAAARTGLAHYVATEQYLRAALGLLAGDGVADDDPLLASLEVERHAALYHLGRLAEADEVYRAIEGRTADALDLVDPAAVQISSLTNRGLATDAVALGLVMLRRLGLTVPEGADMVAEVERGLDELYDWAAEGDEADFHRPEMGEARTVAAAKIINRSMPPAFFSDQTTMAWLVTQARRMWAEHGPSAALVCPLSHAGVVTIALRQDYRTGYGAVRHVLAVSQARGYEPETSQARFLFSVSTGHWFEPLEDDVHEAQRAYEGLLHGGDLMFACFTYHTTTPSLLDCSPTLDSYLSEVESGIAFAARTGNEQTNAFAVAFRQLVRCLRGETTAPGGFEDATFDEAAYVAAIATNPMAGAYFHISRATAAVLFGDTAALTTHAAAAMPLLPFIGSHYSTSRAYLLRALALARTVAAADGAARAEQLSELDSCLSWLTARAADASGNFRHLVRLVEAERAWALGDHASATVAFDSALAEAAARRRPWHRALIEERAGRFLLDRGLSYQGRRLMAEALRLYHEWGATAKVDQIEAAFPGLRMAESTRARGTSTHTFAVSSETIDLLAVLKASQALSSETNLDRLHTRVVEVLSAMTGAGAIHVALRDDETKGWFLPSADGTRIPVAEAAKLGLIPLSAFRYAERTRQPLLVEDATRDDRFARDPYLSDLDHCSLLVVPILSQGTPRAMLVLENRLSRSVFSADRLDTVMLIAGQLAVSIENAMVYASLERKVAERTEALADANDQLKALTITDPLTGLANRRRLSEMLESEWHRSLGLHTCIAVAMIDIDHFKAYNDHYGHLAGDACLRRVAQALGSAVRGTDVLARYGGEEFVIILPGADAAAAYQVAERARAAVAALGEPHAAAPAGIVTVSVGVAGTIPSDDSQVERLIQSADAELYDAKRTGRNRVACRQIP